MKTLQSLFPLSYKIKNGEELAGALVLYILGYYAGKMVSAVLGLLISIINGFMPGSVINFLSFLNVLVTSVGVFVSIYAVIGIVLAILVYRKVIE